MAPISSKISSRRVCSVIEARRANFNKLGGEDAEKAMYHPGELESTFRISATFAGSLLTNVSTSKDLIFRERSKILVCMIINIQELPKMFPNNKEDKNTYVIVSEHQKFESIKSRCSRL